MILKYVLRNFRRRKVRTILMVLSLIVGVGTLVALNATVDSYRRYYTGTVAGEVGDFDMVISRPDTELSPYLVVDDYRSDIEKIPGVLAVAPRIHASVSVKAGEKEGDTSFVALDPDIDQGGTLEITEGEYDLALDEEGIPGAVILQETADVLAVEIGDPIEIQYAPPQVRLRGQEVAENSSRRRTTAQWQVRGIGTQRGLTGESNNKGVIVGLASAQERFGLNGQADRLIVELKPELYTSTNPESSAFDARDVGFAIRDLLGESTFDYRMPRPQAVINGANEFILWQSLVTMYGLLSLGVVGLLIRTLIMTNVQEQTRDMAVMRILGAPQEMLFRLVAVEVIAVGAVGILLGIIVGQMVNNLIIVRFMQEQASGFVVDLPLVSASAVLISVLVAGVVLAISALAPARSAASTKIVHAINPSVADGLGLDDLAKLRERRTDLRFLGGGLVILCFPLLVFYLFPLAFDFGLIWMLALIFFGALLALIVGAALTFFIVILPMERMLLFIIERLAPRVGYFVRRTVLRGKVRNTLISLMIIMSALLPSFLSTSLALDVANTETDRKLQEGAPLAIGNRLSGGQFGTDSVAGTEMDVDFIERLRDDDGFKALLGRSNNFSSTLRDGVGMRSSEVRVLGIDADPREVLYEEAIEISEGAPDVLAQIITEPNTAIIGGGLATYLNRGVGDTVKLVGGGRDHEEEYRIIGVAKRIGGLGVYSAKQTDVWSGRSTVLVGMDSFRQLENDPNYGPPDPNKAIIDKLLAQPAPGLDEAEFTRDLRLRHATENNIYVSSTAESLETVREEAQTGQIFMIVLTALTSVLAVFGVFAVIYVSIYGRRGEIGMMKAFGTPGRHLLLVFVGEAMVMTLSATLTGVAAGVLLAYTFRVSEAFRSEVPTQFAIDPIVVPAMLILMILSSLISAFVATFSLRRKRAIEILRTV